MQKPIIVILAVAVVVLGISQIFLFMQLKDGSTDQNPPASQENQNVQESTSELTDEEFQEGLLQEEIANRDARRRANIRFIGIGMELYYGEYGQYPTVLNLPTTIMSFLPEEPGNGPCAAFQWVPNASNPQLFCLYACLENGNYYLTGSSGSLETPTKPQNLSSCQF